jgi:ABC-type Mn2+/Zn2+ transport system ATPase subunit
MIPDPVPGRRPAPRRARSVDFPLPPEYLLPYMDCIRVDGLSVVRERAEVLREVSLEVRRGERLMIRGPNGAGKTTLLKVLLGLVRPSRGRALVLGQEVDSRAWARERHRVGYVNQESVPVEFPISGREVVEIGACALRLARRERSRRVERALESAGCAHLAGRPYARLSGGEKQKLSIARCLCQDPELLLLDEPTSFLDAASRGDLLRLVRELNEARGITVVLVSHDPDLSEEPGWRTERMQAGAFL